MSQRTSSSDENLRSRTGEEPRISTSALVHLEKGMSYASESRGPFGCTLVELNPGRNFQDHNSNKAN